jgi:putative phosphoserine phosphatase / 1-acylglycerol-3-phosphate O-acyltransferase
LVTLRKSIANRVSRRRQATGEDCLREKIQASPRGEQVAAFFDMDQTLVAGNSSLIYVQRAIAADRAGISDLFKSIYYYLLYRLNRLSVDAVLKPTLESICGRPEADFAEFCRKIALTELVPRISKQARNALQWHKQQGHRCVLLTAATGYMGDPLAESLAMDAALCTRLQVKEGHFTGDLGDLGICYGEGKVEAAQAWAQIENVDLQQSFFYTDSASDLPMLSAVGIPVVVNPDWKLKRFARRRGWLVCRWKLPPR